MRVSSIPRIIPSAILTALLLTACSQDISVDALDDLTFSASNDGVYAKPLSRNYPMQSRFLSVNGQLPVPTTGSACLASSFRVANSIICFSPTGQTHVLAKTFTYGGSLNDLLNLRDEMNALQLDLVQLVKGNGNESLKVNTEAAEGAQTKAAEISKKLHKKNLFVFRWSAEDKANGGGNVGSFLTGKAAAEQNQSGLVIVGGLRVAQLMVGLDDFADTYKTMPEATKMATLTMAADHLVYFSSAALSAALSLDADTTLEQKFKDLPAETQLALNAYYGLARAQDNQGVFSAPGSVVEETLTQAYANTTAKQIFYATMTDVETLIKALNAKVE